MVGNWKLVLNPDVDTYNYRQINNAWAKEIVLEILGEFDLQQARLDYFLLSEDLCSSASYS